MVPAAPNNTVAETISASTLRLSRLGSTAMVHITGLFTNSLRGEIVSSSGEAEDTDTDRRASA